MAARPDDAILSLPVDERLALVDSIWAIDWQEPRARASGADSAAGSAPGGQRASTDATREQNKDGWTSKDAPLPGRPQRRPPRLVVGERGASLLEIECGRRGCPDCQGFPVGRPCGRP
jgi:hypothetical protein